MRPPADEDEPDNAEERFIRHALAVLGIPYAEDTWLHGGSWRKGNLTLTWGARSITDPPTITHPRFPARPHLPRELDERLGAYRAILRQLPDLPFREKVLLTALLNPPTS